MLTPAIPAEESIRLASLRKLDVLDTPAEERFDRLTRLVSAVLSVPIAAVSLVDADRQWFKSSVGLECTETPRDVSFCGHTILRDDPLIVENALADERFADNPLVTGPPFFRFYVGFPLNDGEGNNLGTICAIDSKPRILDERELGILAELAVLAGDELRSIGTDRAVALYETGKARMRVVSGVGDEGLMTFSKAGTVTWVNAAIVRMFGYDPQELVGSRAADLLRPVTGEEELPPWGDTADGSTSTVVGPRELIARHRDGREFIVELAADRSPSDDGSAVICVVRDLTEQRQAELRRRRSEALYRRVFDSVLDGIVVQDRAGAVIGVNTSAERIFGMTAEKMKGRLASDPCWRAVRTDGQPLTESEHPGIVTLRTGDPCREVIMGVHRPDGQLTWISVNAEPLTPDSEVNDVAVDGPGVVCTFTDVTERLKIERLKSEFVSVVSHELRSPLTSIRGALGLMTGELPDGASQNYRRMLDIANTNAERLNRLIDDILDIERIESGRASLSLRQSRSSDLVQQSVEAMQGMADRAGVALRPSESCDSWLWVDPDRIVQALTNLISNAIKFSPTGTDISVSVGRRESEAVFEVADQGRGIPNEMLDTIFERFEQVDASDSREMGGTGLGLAICKSIVVQHGGQVSVRSTIGLGSTFSIALPTLADPESAQDLPATGPTVLVCDVDSDSREVLKSLFQGAGCRVVSAETADDAVEAAKVTRPDALLLDLGQRSEAESEAIVLLTADPAMAEIPVVMIVRSHSGHDGVQVHVRGRAIHPGVLVRRIVDLLAQTAGHETIRSTV